jgi:hypothetical protein
MRAAAPYNIFRDLKRMMGNAHYRFSTMKVAWTTLPASVSFFRIPYHEGT